MSPIDQQEVLENIVDEFTSRMRRGDSPSIDDYTAKHPQLKAEIEELLGSVAMIEDLKLQSEPQNHSLSKRIDEIAHIKKLGDYEIVQEVGRGGMGVVFEAIHSSLGRRVAIKVLPLRSMDNQKYVERFRREAQAAANLHHTNIVSVFGVGHSEGHHYYVMEFVDGAGLDHVIRSLNDKELAVDPSRSTGGTQRLANHETRMLNHRSENTDAVLTNADTLHGEDHTALTVHQNQSIVSSSLVRSLSTARQRFSWAARLGVQVADALHYAHQQRIMHRDIKPANLILDKDQSVWVTDFGLARLESEPSLTHTSDIIGTPQYMAPESFEGKYDQRSEIYCLGITLYELISLQPAFRHKTTQELIHAITNSTPAPLGKVDSSIPRDLQTVIEKAIARNPSDRYKSAADLRDDLRAFIETRPIKARKLSLVEQCSKWSKRNPLTASLTALILLLVIAIAAISSIAYAWQSKSINDLARKHKQLEDQQAETEAARKLAVENEKKIKTEFQRAEANVTFTLESFDEIFKQFLARNSSGSIDLDIDGYSELSGIEFVLTKEDTDYLQSLVSFYEKFAKNNKDNERLQEETARVYRRVANIYHLIGNLSKAVPEYRDAIKRYEKLYNSSSHNGHLINLAQTQSELATTFRKMGKLSSGKKELRDSIRLIEKSTMKSEPTVQIELAKVLVQLATSSWRDEAQMARMASLDPGESPRRRGIGMRQRYRKVRVDPESEALIVRAKTIVNDLLKKDSNRADYRFMLAQCNRCLATFQFAANDLKNGSRLIREALGGLEALCRAHSDVDAYKYSLALTYISESALIQGDVAHLQEAVRIAEKLIQKYPNSHEYQQLEANAKLFLADRMIENKRPRKAIPLADDSLDYFVRAQKEFPRVYTYQYNAVEARAILVSAMMLDDKHDHAAALLKTTIEDMEKNRQRHRTFRQLLARHYQVYARVLGQMGNDAEAKIASQKARQLNASIRSGAFGPRQPKPPSEKDRD